ncbi:unnamed protein product, partial [Rotaria magnacalcarata]
MCRTTYQFGRVGYMQIIRTNSFNTQGL